jgi:peptidyl-prolyl cis-trans isomerase A (cyclophilin A)/peptidyl-prolyl cis-trans isomerase B (cyclophilin B)
MFKPFAFFAALALSTVAFAQDPATAAQPAATTTESTPAPSAAPKVMVRTNMGDITIELYPDKAPKTVENFLAYVQDKHYDGTLFHRVIDGFMVQGGGFTADLKQKTTRAPVANEANNGLSNLRGTVAMARTTDPNSATAQFFVNVVDNTRLDFVSPENGYTWGYCVFGKVVGGMDVVDRIKAVETGPMPPFPKDVPKSPVIINEVTLLQ